MNIIASRRTLLLLALSIIAVFILSNVAVFRVYTINQTSLQFSEQIQSDMQHASDRLIQELALNTSIDTFLQLGDDSKALDTVYQINIEPLAIGFTDEVITNHLAKIDILIENIRFSQRIALNLATQPELFVSQKGITSLSFAKRTMSFAEFKILVKHLTSSINELINYQRNYHEQTLAKMLADQQFFLAVFVGSVAYIIIGLLFFFSIYLKQTKALITLQKQQELISLNNKDKSLFLSNISHEIRTPLNGLYGTIQAIELHHQSPQKVKSYIATAMRSYEHVTSLINNLLNLNKFEQKDNLVLKPTQIGELVKHIVSEQFANAEQKHLQFDTHIPQCEFNQFRMCDELKLSQILRNLVNNAIKFTDAGSVSISVQASEATDNIAFIVSDTGVGIPAEQQERIFESFTQVSEHLDKDFQGSGLGLAIIKHLVELMQGTISVNSEVGKGSTFTVELALPCAEQPQPIITPAPIREALTSHPSILLVEDNDINQMVFSSMLSTEALDVAIADDGFMALELAEKQDFDLIFMDIQMPRMDGVETMKKLYDNGFDKPIIALTGNVMPEQIESYFEAGFVEVIAKPYKRETILLMIERYCEKSSERESQQDDQQVAEH